MRFFRDRDRGHLGVGSVARVEVLTDDEIQIGDLDTWLTAWREYRPVVAPDGAPDPYAAPEPPVKPCALEP